MGLLLILDGHNIWPKKYLPGHPFIPIVELDQGPFAAVPSIGGNYPLTKPTQDGYPEGWKIMAADTNPIESKPETLSESLERITAEKLVAVNSQQDALAAEVLAINKNAVNDVMRVLVVDTLNDESKFKLPADMDLDSDLNLALEFSVATGRFTLAVKADVKVPEIKTVIESSRDESARNTTLDFLDAPVFDHITDSATASAALKQGVRLTIIGLEQWLDPGASAGSRPHRNGHGERV